MNKLISALLVLSLLQSEAGLADQRATPSPCPFGETDNGLMLRQQKFADGSWDLAIIDMTAASKPRRITYGGSKLDACHYFSVAMARGGDWGWHLAWADTNGLYYARMDGAAWVSSPPKRLSRASVREIQFVINADILTISWLEPHENNPVRVMLKSLDEGRNWEP